MLAGAFRFLGYDQLASPLVVGSEVLPPLPLRQFTSLSNISIEISVSLCLVGPCLCCTCGRCLLLPALMLPSSSPWHSRAVCSCWCAAVTLPA